MMKKILLGTSAIIGASVLLAAPAFSAEKPKLEMSGFLRFEAWNVDQDAETTDRDIGFQMDDAEIHFKGSAKADNGLEYGFYVEMQEGTADRTSGYDEANVYLAGGWGRLELGSNDAVHNNWKMGAYALSADKDGAWDGDALFVRTNNSAFVGTDFFGGDDANKMTYTSPSFGGFTLGASYVPSSEDSMDSNLADDAASAAGFLNGGNGNMHDQIGLAGRYVATFGDVGVEATARYARANYVDTAVLADREDAEAWGIGAKVTFAGFSVAGSWQDLRDSGLTAAQQTAGADVGGWWDIGVSYGFGPYKVSAIYMNSEADLTSTDKDEIDYYSLGFGYAAAPGLDLYATYQFVDLDNGAQVDDEVNMFMIGTQVSF